MHCAEWRDSKEVFLQRSAVAVVVIVAAVAVVVVVVVASQVAV